MAFLGHAKLWTAQIYTRELFIVENLGPHTLKVFFGSNCKFFKFFFGMIHVNRPPRARRHARATFMAEASFPSYLMRNHQTRHAPTAITTTMMASVLSPLVSLTVLALANATPAVHQPFQHPAPICELHGLLMQTLKQPHDSSGCARRPLPSSPFKSPAISEGNIGSVASPRMRKMCPSWLGMESSRPLHI
jgi:hypothetical protein